MKSNSIKNLETLRHSLSHILAWAVQELYPGTKFGIGPAIENGFYYDFGFRESLTSDQLPKIEKRMKELLKNNIKFEKKITLKEEAKKLFSDQPYKLELIEELPGKTATIYQSGDFIDLCKGPHVKSTKEIDSLGFKLTKIAGAYWRGLEKNPMLTRIYGIAFENKKDLDDYLKKEAEAEMRDHRKIGERLDWFSFHPEAPGSVFWHPKGMIIWNELENFGKSLRKKYQSQEIQTPQLAKKVLWEKSGHWDHYKDSMFSFEVEDETYCLKPMDCPFNIKIYQTKIRSYKELPIRYTEIGRVMRNEKSGEIYGLFRVRSMTQDDAHIFAAKEQVEKEISILLKMVKEYYKAFGIKPEFFLSTRPDDFIGEISTWNKAEINLKNALIKEKIKYGIKEKDGAFYGPKIDINIKDALGRSWQLATIQLDFQLPQRFNIEYIDKYGKKKSPVIIHAAIFGTFERFIGILIEHYAGALPFWLSPVQVWVIPIGSRHEKYAKKVCKELEEKGLRVELKDENDTVSKKIREGEIQKIPCLLVVGDKEMKNKSVRVRERGKGDIGEMKIKRFVEKTSKELKKKV